MTDTVEATDGVPETIWVLSKLLRDIDYDLGGEYREHVELAIDHIKGGAEPKRVSDFNRGYDFGAEMTMKTEAAVIASRDARIAELESATKLSAAANLRLVEMLATARNDALEEAAKRLDQFGEDGHTYALQVRALRTPDTTGEA